MSIKDIKHRIKSIENIRQVTKAMGLISTTKLQKMRIKLEVSRRFFVKTEQLSNIICGSNCYSEPKNKRCVILISGDRGLCGTYNVNVGRFAIDLCKEKKDSAFVLIGNGASQIVRRNGIDVDYFFSGISESPDMVSAKKISDLAIDFYEKGYEIYLVYTKFRSAMNSKPVYKKILPLPSGKSDIIFEPERETVERFVVPKYLQAVIFFALLEAAVCEQSSRMVSMNAATDSADEMLAELNLKYNRLRQNQITQELVEIISGANALIN